MTPTELVERVIELGHERLPEVLELVHPDAEWIVGDERPPLRGHEEIARFVAAELDRLGAEVPEPITNSLTQNGDVVLVYGQLKIPHNHGRRFVEVRQIAWVYEVEGDRIARVTIYKTWDEARTAAGIERGTPPTRRFDNWRLAVARLRPRLLQLVTS
jgi:ketosteroid isomerase-like protein